MSQNGQRRVVITGLGMVSPLGNTVEDSWAALIAGESGAGVITQFDTTGFPVDFACEVKDLEVTDYVDYKASRRMDRFTHLALAAARQAESDAGLDIASEAERVGAAVATGIGGLKSFEACIQVLDSRGPDRVNPFSIVQIIPNLAAELRYALAAADDTESGCGMKGDGGRVLLEDGRLDRPDPVRRCLLDECGEERAPDTLPAPGLRDVDRVLDHAAVHVAPRDRRDGDPADHLVVFRRDQPRRGKVRRVPRVPGRNLGLEGRVARGDPLGVDPCDRRPVGGDGGTDERHTGNSTDRRTPASVVRSYGQRRACRTPHS